MNSRRLGRRAATTLLFLLLGGYSALGWCPPPPGVFLPDHITYDLGPTKLGATTRISINFVLNPLYSGPPFGVFSISPSPYTLVSNQENSFAVDSQQTTCVPGAVVTTMSGCVLTVGFTPTSPGTKTLGEFILNACESTLTPCASEMVIGSVLMFTGVGFAQPVPALARSGIILLAMLLIGFAYTVLHLNRR